VDRASLPYNGAWSDFYSESGPAEATTKLHLPQGQPTQLPLSRSLVIKGGAVNASTTVLDLSALHSLYVLPSGRNNASQNGTLTTLTFSNLTLVNAPPGPFSTYPLGMSALMMWSVDMDRYARKSAAHPCIFDLQVCTCITHNALMIERPPDIMSMVCLMSGSSLHCEGTMLWWLSESHL
jgi:hypothetical protein